MAINKIDLGVALEALAHCNKSVMLFSPKCRTFNQWHKNGYDILKMCLEIVRILLLCQKESKLSLLIWLGNMFVMDIEIGLCER